MILKRVWIVFREVPNTNAMKIVFVASSSGCAEDFIGGMSREFPEDVYTMDSYLVDAVEKR